MFEELLCRQIAGLSPIEDRLGDIRREIAEADEPCEIGPADPFPLRECGKVDAFALGECRVECDPVRFLNCTCGSRCGGWWLKTGWSIEMRPRLARADKWGRNLVAYDLSVCIL